jgi:hypothetical protein
MTLSGTRRRGDGLVDGGVVGAGVAGLVKEENAETHGDKSGCFGSEGAYGDRAALRTGMIRSFPSQSDLAAERLPVLPSVGLASKRHMERNHG